MIEYFLFVTGLVLLLKSADYVIEGASSLARKWGISTLVIGLTIVAFGTSLPEFIINVIAALDGSGGIALGNVIGSNMANTLLILGLMALIADVKLKASTEWKEVPFAFLAVLVLFIFAIRSPAGQDSVDFLSWADGLVLLLFFVIFLYYVFETSRTDKTLKKEMDEQNVKTYSGIKSSAMIMVGLFGLFIGGKWTVEGAVYIARVLGLSEFLISATVIAIGTSLPEVVTAVMAAIKKDVDLAVGSIIGSNIFNILWVLGITSLIAPLELPWFVRFDLLLLLMVTFVLFIFMFIGKKHEFDRWQGIAFILLYIGYLMFIVLRG